MEDIINLFRKFKIYSSYTDYDLCNYLYPSIKLNQYKKHFNKNNLIGFTNWALLSEKAEKKKAASCPAPVLLDGMSLGGPTPLPA